MGVRVRVWVSNMKSIHTSVAIMKRRRFSRLGFLPQVPVGNLLALQEQRRSWDAQALANDSGAGIDQGLAVRVSDSTPSEALEHVRHKRKDMPIVRKVGKGDLDRAVSAASSCDNKQSALEKLVDDMYASTSKKPRDALLNTWVKLHTAWFGETGEPPFPLDEAKIVRVSALFKNGGYKSYKNYLSRAKDRRLQLGYQWSENLNRKAQKCTRSVIRGLAGATRSEAFDLIAVHQALDGIPHSLAVGGPAHPAAG